jgi:putative transposase
LTGNYGAIAIEDLNVKDMLKHRYLARAIADMGFHEFRRQLIYKAQLRGNHIEIADRWFPSSKLSETGLNEAGTKPCTDLYTF